MSRTSKELGEMSKVATPESSTNAQATAQPVAKAGALKSGDVLTSKINKVKLFKEPSKKADKAVLLSKSDDMIYMGEEANDFYKVTATNGEGWVEKLLVQKAI